MRSLSDYLNIEDTVKCIKEVTKVPFFNEGNLFDLVVKKELQPIIYFDGCGSIFTSKERSLYPEDFESDTDSNDFDFGKVSDNEQLNYVKGYFYLMFGELLLKAAKPEQHFQFKIQNLVDYKAIPNKALPNSGMNSKYDVYKKTPLYSGDFIMLSTYEDTNPSFSKVDVKFYVLDIINMIERNGYYSANEDKQAGTPANDDKELPANSQAAVTRLLNVLFHMGGHELTAHSGTLRERLIRYSERPDLGGATISEGFLTPWLKRVQDLRLKIDDKNRGI